MSSSDVRQLVLRPLDGTSGELAVFVRSDEEVDEALAFYRARIVSVTPSSEADMAFKTMLALQGLTEWWKVGTS